MPKNASRSETANKISVLIRIYRSAVKSGDDALRQATAAELRSHGINVAESMAAPSDKGGAQ